MAGGYRAQPQGMAKIEARFRDIERSLAALRRTLTNPLIANDSLFSPVVPAVGTNSGTGLDGTAGFATVVEVHLEVPAGFTTALVSAVGSSGASCDAGGATQVEAAVFIANVAGHVRSARVEAGTGGGTGCSFARVLTGLDSGGDVGVSVVALQSPAAPVVAGSVGGDLSVSVIFLR